MKTFNDIDPILSDQIISFIYNKDSKLNMGFYGYFFTRINFEEVNDDSTACVYVKGSRLYLRYNKSFIEKLSVKEVRFLLMHELSHLLFSHLNRIGDRDMRKSNIVADMIINSTILSDFDDSFKLIEGNYKLDNGSELEIPRLLIPREYKGRPIFEELYDWLQEETDKDKNEGGDQDSEDSQDGQGSGNSEGGSDNSGKGSDNSKKGSSKSGESEEFKTGKRLFKDIEEGKDVRGTDEHGDLSKADKELMDSITKEIVEGLKNKGLVTSDIEQFLGKLTSSRKNNLKWILQNLSFVLGEKVNQTWIKPNRYDIKGKKGENLIGTQLNVILDVSGSMYGLHEKVLNTVYQNGIACNIILADTEVKGFIQTKSKKDLQSIKLKGFGGTELQPAVEFIKARKDLKDINTLVLTDGYCDKLDFSGLKTRKMIITTDIDVKYIGSNVKQKKLEV